MWPRGALIARRYCPENRTTFSLLPRLLGGAAARNAAGTGRGGHARGAVAESDEGGRQGAHRLRWTSRRDGLAGTAREAGPGGAVGGDHLAAG